MRLFFCSAKRPYRRTALGADHCFAKVKAVHGDVTALLNAGMLDRTEDSQIVFPFEAVNVEFLLRAA
ncbi:hypothetical protein [Aromatoleum tolulyticum]|uniref:hypothetical protein n=1 Tax=Aromatoleum tolulyticum TaxID=34027 RepID=UPI001FCD751E|nr:hypothetical protein [Aromatoleum tolulyticum]